mgnify:CR=1 FL=1
MRATDGFGLVGTASPIGRSCDRTLPGSPNLTVDRPNHYELELSWQESYEVGSGLDFFQALGRQLDLDRLDQALAQSA